MVPQRKWGAENGINFFYFQCLEGFWGAAYFVQKAYHAGGLGPARPQTGRNIRQSYGQVRTGLIQRLTKIRVIYPKKYVSTRKC